jgi:hypothetical protein
VARSVAVGILCASSCRGGKGGKSPMDGSRPEAGRVDPEGPARVLD